MADSLAQRRLVDIINEQLLEDDHIPGFAERADRLVAAFKGWLQEQAPVVESVLHETGHSFDVECLHDDEVACRVRNEAERPAREAIAALVERMEG